MPEETTCCDTCELNGLDAQTCCSCPLRDVDTMEQSVDPLYELLDDGCKWIFPHPSAQ